MARKQIFTMRVTLKEQATIAHLAEIQHRSKSSAVRYLLILIANRLEKDPNWLYKLLID